MKRIVLFAMAVLGFTALSVAQKYALVDMEYILKIFLRTKWPTNS